MQVPLCLLQILRKLCKWRILTKAVDATSCWVKYLEDGYSKISVFIQSIRMILFGITRQYFWVSVPIYSLESRRTNNIPCSGFVPVRQLRRYEAILVTERQFIWWRHLHVERFNLSRLANGGSFSISFC